MSRYTDDEVGSGYTAEEIFDLPAEEQPLWHLGQVARLCKQHQVRVEDALTFTHEVPVVHVHVNLDEPGEKPVFVERWRAGDVLGWLGY